TEGGAGHGNYWWPAGQHHADYCAHRMAYLGSHRHQGVRCGARNTLSATSWRYCALQRGWSPYVIEILTNSSHSSIQDLGRFGRMSLGVGCGGAMDTVALRIGNWLTGGEGGEAAIEVAQFPFRIRFHTTLRY